MEETRVIEIDSNKMFGGCNKRYRHYSPTLGCNMIFSVFFPPLDRRPLGDKCPVLYWLSGFASTSNGFIERSGAQRCAAVKGIALVAPDTSPRGLNVELIEGQTDMNPWHVGLGAGWYLNAANDKWKNWRMYDYVVKELPTLLSKYFEELDTSRASIFGHCMGGHGALTIYLKNLDKYKSVSAFAPIVNPINCSNGQEAFSNYLGTNRSDWEEYDATCLIKKFKFKKFPFPILIDQGEDDPFLSEMLPHKFKEACKSANVPLILRMQPGYNYSYYLIASFMDDHIFHHALALE
ncbi:S-formylglutathione hydrolase [Carex littledalei]|uniref:S-formylglutathione hydrolase n=1 Tax=Carex littledalei TaxID=544730 RepID=A0A833RYZ5_9POAL|nr:S-formylglutathione hydrolase [Carex littledalei]